MQSGNIHVPFFSGHEWLDFVGRDQINENQSFWGGVYNAPAEISDNYFISLNCMEDYSMPEESFWTFSLIPHCRLHLASYRICVVTYEFWENFHCERQNAQGNQRNNFIKPIAIGRMSSMGNIWKIKGRGPQGLQRHVTQEIIPSLMGVMSKDGDESHWGRVKASLTSGQVGAGWSLEVSSFLELERVGRIFLLVLLSGSTGLKQSSTLPVLPFVQDEWI